MISRQPLYTFYKTCVWEWSLNEVEPLTYAKLQFSWLAFCELLDFGSSQKNAFNCTVCGDNPDTVICDGITLGLQKRYLQADILDKKTVPLEGLR